MMKISVIIPVYNCDSKITRTLDSIKNQTYKNFEIIIINDGSTDKSKITISNYISKNPDLDISFFDISNGGVSNARNIGLDNCSGNCVLFLDADDWIDKNYFENCIKDIVGYDIIFYSYKSYYNNSQIEHLIKEKEIYSGNDKIQFFEYLCKHNLFNPVCNKVCTRALVENIRFNRNLKIGEDLDFFTRCFINADSFCFYNKSYYNYDININGLAFRKKSEIYKQKVEMLANVEKMYDLFSTRSRTFLGNLYAKAYFSEVISYDYGIGKNNYKEIVKRLNKIKDISEFNISLTYNFLRILYQVSPNLIRNLISICILKIDEIKKNNSFGIKSRKKVNRRNI